jgi:hypothetical protein
MLCMDSDSYVCFACYTVLTQLLNVSTADQYCLLQLVVHSCLCVTQQLCPHTCSHTNTHSLYTYMYLHAVKHCRIPANAVIYGMVSLEFRVLASCCMLVAYTLFLSVWDSASPTDYTGAITATSSSASGNSSVITSNAAVASTATTVNAAAAVTKRSLVQRLVGQKSKGIV